MTQRSAAGAHPNQWEFPGGKVEELESPEGAVVREIKEELGILVTPKKRLEEILWQYPNKTIALLPIICEIRLGKINLLEHQRLEWLNLDETARLDVLEADKMIIKQLKSLP